MVVGRMYFAHAKSPKEGKPVGDVSFPRIHPRSRTHILKDIIQKNQGPFSNILSRCTWLFHATVLINNKGEEKGRGGCESAPIKRKGRSGVCSDASGVMYACFESWVS